MSKVELSSRQEKLLSWWRRVVVANVATAIMIPVFGIPAVAAAVGLCLAQAVTFIVYLHGEGKWEEE